MDILQSAASAVAAGKRAHPRVKQEPSSSSSSADLPAAAAAGKRAASEDTLEEPSTSPSRDPSSDSPPSPEYADDEEYLPGVDADEAEEEEEEAGAEVLPALEGYAARGHAARGHATHRKQGGVKLHITSAATKSVAGVKRTSNGSRHPAGAAAAAASNDPKANSNHTAASAQQRRASARNNVGKKPTHGKAYSSDSEYSGTNIPFTSASRPSRLILSINKNPLKILRVNVQRHFFSQQQQKQIEISGHSGAIDEAVVTAPVRLMGTPQRENLYFVAKDVCLLIHTRRGNVAKSICQFESDEKARMPVVCPRQNGSFSTHVLSVLTIKGVKHLLGSSRSALAPHVLRWLLAQVDHLCDGSEEPPSVVPQMSDRAKETLGGRGPVHSAEGEADRDDEGDTKVNRAGKSYPSTASTSNNGSTKAKRERPTDPAEEEREWDLKRQRMHQAAASAAVAAQRQADEELQDLQAAAVQSYQANQQAQQMMQQQQLQAPPAYMYPPYYSPYPAPYPGGMLPPSYPVAVAYSMPYAGYPSGVPQPGPPQNMMQNWPQPQQMPYGYGAYPQAYQMQTQQPPPMPPPQQPQPQQPAATHPQS